MLNFRPLYTPATDPPVSIGYKAEWAQEPLSVNRPFPFIGFIWPQIIILNTVIGVVLAAELRCAFLEGGVAFLYLHSSVRLMCLYPKLFISLSTNFCILGQTFCVKFDFLRVPYKEFFTRSLSRLQTLLMKSEVAIRYSDEAPSSGIWTRFFNRKKLDSSSVGI
jgi:hypothetical protein